MRRPRCDACNSSRTLTCRRRGRTSIALPDTRLTVPETELLRSETVPSVRTPLLVVPRAGRGRLAGRRAVRPSVERRPRERLASKEGGLDRVGGTECRLSQPQADKFDTRPPRLPSRGRPRRGDG